MTNHDRVRRVLIVRTDRLGETVLTLPLIQAIRACAPSGRLHVTLLVHPELRELLEHLPGVEQLLIRHAGRARWWREAIALARQWRPQRFDVALIANPTKAIHAATWLAGIPRRIGYDRKWGWCLTHRLPDRKALGDRHEVDYNLDLIRALGVQAPIAQWRWPDFEPESAAVARALRAQGLSAGDPFLVVHPWASTARKQWPLERYRAVIRWVMDSLGLAVVLVGQPDPRGGAPHATVIPSQPGVVDLAGGLTLRELAALLRCARALLSNDSGPVHLAAALQTPTVVLFGTTEAATGPRRWGPWGTGHTVICRPTMEAIATDEVCAALGARLAPQPVSLA